jgi:predicted membrane-bound spermidine synthase
MTALLCAIFFLSGAAGLLFETLWFHQAGLSFGNGVWASSLVLAGFMAGLALGNAAVARWGGSITRPVRFYAGLEVVIALSGIGLVYALPHFTAVLTPLLRPVLDEPWLLNPLRLGIGFTVLLIPSTAMGATLPVLVKALLARDPSFGSAIGRLYGWNTLGAVVGALAAEGGLLELFGVRGSAWVAGSLNGIVAVAAVALSGRFVSGSIAAAREASLPLSPRAKRLLAAAFLSGFVLLALEVVWFRFLQLWVHTSSWIFSVMLAVVLANMAVGGLVGGAVLRRWPQAHRGVPVVSALGGVFVVSLYAAFALQDRPASYLPGFVDVLRIAGPLMAPVAFLSGIAFTWLAAAVEEQLAPATRAAGWMTFANTIGAGMGSLIAGFLLLPWLGMEVSFFVLAALYGVVAVLSIPQHLVAVPRRFAVAAAVAWLVALVAFPFGFMNERFVTMSAGRYADLIEGKILVVEEGRSETAILLERSLAGQTLSHYLMTNGHGMSSTDEYSRRYMKLYVYLPVALHPNPQRALLISYGLGNTARALLDTPGMEQVEIVDLSREILGLADRVFPDAGRNPLRDPRVNVHVEDGRHFLETTSERFDLITGEPPPPKNAGIVNLYTREYFQLAHDRLTDGGMHTYWLPVHGLTERDSRSIIAAYCAVFTDCSLWLGTTMDWMLVGSRGAQWQPDLEAFARQWRAPVVAGELRALGFEVPALMATTFIADASQLAELAGDALPLTDNWPHRLSSETGSNATLFAPVASWVDPAATQKRFSESEWVKRTLPAEVRDRAMNRFTLQSLVNQHFLPGLLRADDPAAQIRNLHFELERTRYSVLPLWELGSDSDRVAAANASTATEDLMVRYHRAAARLAGRDFVGAAEAMVQIVAEAPTDRPVLRNTLYALCRAGRLEEANALAAGQRGQRIPAAEAGYWAWMNRTFGLFNPLAER